MTPKLKSLFELDLVEIRTRMIDELKKRDIDGYKVFVSGLYTYALAGPELYARIEVQLEQPDKLGLRLVFVDIPITDLC